MTFWKIIIIYFQKQIKLTDNHLDNCLEFWAYTRWLIITVGN
jgi:hypothetical protein